MNRKNRSSGNAGWLILLAAVLWGTTGTAQAFAPPHASPLAIGAIRLALGGVILLVFALSKGSLRGKDWPYSTTTITALAMAAYQPFFFAGIARTGVAVGTMVTIGSAPIIAGFLGLIIRGERPGGRWAIATALAICGSVLLLSSGNALSVNASGFPMALCAGAAYATFAVASKKLLEDHSPEAVIAVVFCLSAILLTPLLMITDLSWLIEPRGLLVAIHLGLVATAIAYILFARGLASLPVATAVTLSLAEPLAAALLGVTVLGERLTPLACVGMFLLFLGLVILSRSK